MKEFLIKITTYLLKNLPLDKQVLRDVRILHPNWLCNENSADAISRLASVLWKSLGKEKMVEMFKMKPTDEVCDFIDMIGKEFS